MFPVPTRLLPIIGTLVLGIVVLGAVFFFLSHDEEPMVVEEAVTEEVLEEAPVLVPYTDMRIIGQSVLGRPIEAYRFGNGETNLLFVGGIHGGYEWNSVLLAYEAIDYFTQQENAVPENITITIVPSANPDGVYKVIQKEGRFSIDDTIGDPGDGTGRFNANGVDLNRNFDCKWQPESSWRGNVVSAGTEPFSEPEARAIKELVGELEPEAVVFWHSQSNAVYASECTEGILPGTLTLMNTYANAAGYPAVDTFDAYPVTGDAEGWLASIGIPAVTVELATHKTIEWEKNLRGIEALLSYYGGSSE